MDTAAPTPPTTRTAYTVHVRLDRDRLLADYAEQCGTNPVDLWDHLIDEYLDNRGLFSGAAGQQDPERVADLVRKTHQLVKDGTLNARAGNGAPSKESIRRVFRCGQVIAQEVRDSYLTRYGHENVHSIGGA